VDLLINNWYKRIPDKTEARKYALFHRLMMEREMKVLFPVGQLYTEKLFGLNKSFVARG
jgi:hypothetical protein